MTEARFLTDSLGATIQNPRFDGCMLDVAGNASQGQEAERIASAKLAVWGSRAMHRAEVRIAKGLLLEAAPEDRQAAEDSALSELPTEEFEIVAANSDDPERMKRIRRTREEKKSPVDRRKEEAEARYRQERAMEAMQERLKGRRLSAAKRPGRSR